MLMAHHHVGALGGSRAAGAAAGWIGSRPIGERRLKLKRTPSLRLFLKSPWKIHSSTCGPWRHLRKVFLNFESVFSLGLVLNTVSLFTKLPLDLN